MSRILLTRLDVSIRALASISHLHCLQHCRLYYQCIYELYTSAGYEECLWVCQRLQVIPEWNANVHYSHLVHYWLHGHLHHGACMLFARLQLRKVRIGWVYQGWQMLISIGLCLANFSIRQDVRTPHMNLNRIILTSIGPDGIAWLLGVCYA